MKHFLLSARLNLAVASFLATVFGGFQTLRLVLENQIPPQKFANLTLFLADQTVTGFFLAFIGTAALLTLVLGPRRRSEIDVSRLVQKEALLIVAGVSVLIITKKYFVHLLPSSITYLVFYLSHWTRENMIIFLSIIFALLLISGLTKKYASLEKCFGLRLAGVCLLLLFVVKGTAEAHDAKLQGKLITQKYPNVIFITVDTLRADHLSVYGYPRQSTPNLDRLARESALFTQAIAAWPKTNQSFASLMTGKYSYRTKMGFRLASFLPRNNLLLAEVLKNAGYHTVALVSNANLSRYFNFADGFDEYVELWRKQKGPAQERVWYDAARVTQETVDWLEKNHSKKFFLWVHYIDPHTPYTPPAPYHDLFLNDPYDGRYEEVPADAIKETNRLGTQRDPDFYIAQYDGEIRYTDDQVRVVLNKLQKLNLLDNTLLVFTADHGESLDENGFYFDHGKYAYDNCSRVPLMIRFPREIQAPRTIDEAVSLTDLFPTVTEFLGLSVETKLDGHSLASALRDGTWDRLPHAFIEAGFENRYQRAIRTKDWKLIATSDLLNPQTPDSSEFELYDLKQDRLETTDLSGKRLAVEDELKHLLRPWGRMPKKGGSKTGKEVSELDAESLEQLKTLGYVN